MSFQRLQKNNWLPGLAAALVFILLALVRTGPALFSPDGAVAAFEEPDTSMHLWIFWRTKNALLGNDHGYLTSHVLTYPTPIREPMAVYDPLLPLLSVPLQLILPSLSLVFNFLIVLGLVFTAWAGYRLTSFLAGDRAVGIIGGVIIAFNPFIYRQLAAGFLEYAWWGVFPLTIWLYLRAASRRDLMAIALYVLGLVSLLLMSIYCAYYFLFTLIFMVVYQIAVAVRSRDRFRRRRVFKIQAVALFCVLPLLVFWIYNLSRISFKCLPWKQEFTLPMEHLPRPPGDPLPPPSDPADPPPPPPPPPSSAHLPEPVLLSLRTTTGSLDCHYLMTGRPLSVVEMMHYKLGWENIIYGREWLLVILFALTAFLGRRGGVRNLKWLALAGFFFLLALGPFLISNRYLVLIGEGNAAHPLGLPFLWLYKWLPGFSRLFIPVRAVLGTIVCLSVLACRGMASARRRFWPALSPLARVSVYTGLALVVFFSFTPLGNMEIALPASRIEVPAFYLQVAEDPEPFALLELPTAGRLTYRCLFQTVHQKPIFKGAVPGFMVNLEVPFEASRNRFVELLDRREPGPTPEADLTGDLAALASLGFRYLVLHSEESQKPEVREQNRLIAESYLGPPVFEDARIVVWRIEEPVPAGSHSAAAPPPSRQESPALPNLGRSE